MYAAIYIPDFPVEAIMRAEPELREQAVAVVEGTPPLVHVVAVNERAAHAGIEPGMTKLQAEERVDGRRSMVDGEPSRPGPTQNSKSRSATPVGGTIRQRSTEREAAAHAALLDCACGFSPRVEATAADTAVLDVAGLERIFGAPSKIARDIARRCSEMGLEANVAVASNVDTAVVAARGFAGVTVIAEGAEAQRLGELSVETLVDGKWSVASGQWLAKSPLGGERAATSVEILETLERWGVRNLRALAALPEVALAERLGQQGLQLQKLARGEARRALVVSEPPLEFEEALELEYPVESLDALAFVLSRMLEQLCVRLASRALATNELKLALELEANATEDLAIWRSGDRVIKDSVQITGSPDHQITRCLRLPVPMLDAKVFLKLMLLDLQAHPPQSAVTKVWLRAEAAEPRRVQNGLFAPEAPQAERLELTIARIKKVVGEKAEEQNNCRSPIVHCRLQASGPKNRQSVIENQQCSSEARVGSPEILDTHRADGWQMKRFQASGQASVMGDQNALEGERAPTSVTAMRVFRPALAAVVMVKDGQPAQISSPERPAMRGDVVWCAGPWQLSGEWWSDQVWSRQEWDVAVRNEEGVAVYRIYRDEIGGKWWVEGSYD